MSQSWIIVLGGGRSVQLQKAFHSGWLEEGPAHRLIVCPIAPPRSHQVGQGGDMRGACMGREGSGAQAGVGGGPIAACRAPPSSLPGSIRDQTPSNAAQ